MGTIRNATSSVDEVVQGGGGALHVNAPLFSAAAHALGVFLAGLHHKTLLHTKKKKKIHNRGGDKNWLVETHVQSQHISRE